MKTPTGTKEKVIIKPRPPKNMTDEPASTNPVDPEEVPDPLAGEPDTQTPPTPPAPAPAVGPAK